MTPNPNLTRQNKPLCLFPRLGETPLNHLDIEATGFHFLQHYAFIETRNRTNGADAMRKISAFFRHYSYVGQTKAAHRASTHHETGFFRHYSFKSKKDENREILPGQVGAEAS